MWVVVETTILGTLWGAGFVGEGAGWGADDEVEAEGKDADGDCRVTRRRESGTAVWFVRTLYIAMRRRRRSVSACCWYVS